MRINEKCGTTFTKQEKQSISVGLCAAAGRASCFSKVADDGNKPSSSLSDSAGIWGWRKHTQTSLFCFYLMHKHIKDRRINTARELVKGQAWISMDIFSCMQCLLLFWSVQEVQTKCEIFRQRLQLCTLILLKFQQDFKHFLLTFLIFNTISERQKLNEVMGKNTSNVASFLQKVNPWAHGLEEKGFF